MEARLPVRELLHDHIVEVADRQTAYDLKLVMNKDVCDVIRPQWILDCVAQEEIVPLTKKYALNPILK